jgi:hypothetical protein
MCVFPADAFAQAFGASSLNRVEDFALADDNSDMPPGTWKVLPPEPNPALEFYMAQFGPEGTICNIVGFTDWIVPGDAKELAAVLMPLLRERYGEPDTRVADEQYNPDDTEGYRWKFPTADLEQIDFAVTTPRVSIVSLRYVFDSVCGAPSVDAGL